LVFGVQRSEKFSNFQAKSQSFFLFFSVRLTDQHSSLSPFETLVPERVAKVRRLFKSAITWQNFFSFFLRPC
ncbi:hypothetical protein, partial [Pontibacter sp. BAB1700]|uniref:hypothetical protein n=1 Tax=Pontibacter sp. BAB1700 TaxID=1144253 RepID=UPI001ED94F51